MRAQDRLLLFLALEGAPEGLDPVRLQKGMFLFAQEVAPEDDEKYEFVPYNYGPMSAAIYRDLDTLVKRQLVEARPVSGHSWSRYIATESGVARARQLMSEDASPLAAQRLHEIKEDVASKSFSAVLEDVYERYPEFAEKSVFRRAS